MWWYSKSRDDNDHSNWLVLCVCTYVPIPNATAFVNVCYDNYIAGQFWVLYFIKIVLSCIVLCIPRKKLTNLTLTMVLLKCNVISPECKQLKKLAN